MDRLPAPDGAGEWKSIHCEMPPAPGNESESGVGGFAATAARFPGDQVIIQAQRKSTRTLAANWSHEKTVIWLHSAAALDWGLESLGAR
jgi:hypothetical protein